MNIMIQQHVHFVVLALLHADTGALAIGMSVQIARYDASPASRLGMSPLEAPRTVRSMTSCAAECEKLEGQCYSFAYKRSSRLCTVGTKVSLNSTKVSTDHGELYVKQVCESTEGFQIWSNGQMSSCVFTSTDSRNYTDALQECADMNSQLITLPSLDKWNLFTSEVEMGYSSKTALWVGMDDLAEEGRFLWSDGSSVTNLQFMKDNGMFARGEPDNSGDEQDCIRYRFFSGKHKLFDGNCENAGKYVCEKLI